MGSSVFSVWATSFAFDAGRYLLAAGVAFALFWVWGRERFRHRLVQREYPGPAHLRRELGYSALTVLIFAAVGVTLFFGSRAGVFHIYEEVAEYGYFWFAATLVLLPLLHDTYFYWTHRAMHHPALYKHVHRVHHLSTNPSPWAAYAFAPVEALVHAAFVPLVTLFMPVNQIALFVFLTFMILRNVLGHLGMELFPKRFVRSRWWRWSTTTTHHNMHHRRLSSNYGLYLTLWDRWMGTTHADYESTFEEVASRTPARGPR